MNYSKHYDLLIEKADNRCIIPGVYKERHHIIPKCMGEDNSKENLVDLFPEEHFLAHQLLVKIYPKNNKLIFAISCFMMKSENQVRNNKKYKWLKIKSSKNHSEYMKEYWKTHKNPMKGKKHSKETIEKMKNDPRRSHFGKSNGFYGKKHSKETIEKMKNDRKGELNGMFGKKHTEQSKKIMKEKAIGRPSGFKGSFHSEHTKHILSVCAEKRAKIHIFVVENVRFKGTMKEAYTHFDLPRSTFENRIKSPNYPNYIMI